MRYRLVMDTKYRVSGRLIKNMKGTLVIFHDGVANSVNQDIADYASKMYYISDVLPIGEEVAEVAPVVIGTDILETESEAEEEMEEEEDVVEEDSQPTAEQIQTLYGELGTWTAVAESLGITTATLRKYREALGLL